MQRAQLPRSLHRLASQRPAGVLHRLDPLHDRRYAGRLPAGRGGCSLRLVGPPVPELRPSPGLKAEVGWPGAPKHMDLIQNYNFLVKCCEQSHS